MRKARSAIGTTLRELRIGRTHNFHGGSRFPKIVRGVPALAVWPLLYVLVLFMIRFSLEVMTMEDAKQRELIRLWNLMRKAQGPVAEEIRIQILAQFERVEKKAA